MANTKSKTTKTDTAKQTKKIESDEVVEAAAKAADEEPIVDTKKQQYTVKNRLEPTTMVTVKNGYQGSLVYISNRTKERFTWAEFGDEQDMELQELKNARNSSKGFFERNWFLIDDPEVIEYIGVQQYYKNALTYDGLSELFELSPAEIKEKVSKLSDGQKKTVAYRAKQLIADGAIDSMKVISALEDSLSVELIDR